MDDFSKTYRFTPANTPPDSILQAACWLLFQGEDLVLADAAAPFPLPLAASPAAWGIETERTQFLGQLERGSGAPIPCFSAEVDANLALPDGLTCLGLRQLFTRFEPEIFGLISRAKQIVAWDRDHQFCGRCAAPMQTLAHERAKRCPACGLTSYPRLSPAIIVAVTRPGPDGEEILLARNHRFPAGRYSVIAGFVEPGESLEECVRREVGEEVGVQVDAIRYFGSQPWPFPHSLMLGFTARYAGGEICLEASEIAEAGWFSVHELPQVPPKVSIARQLIDGFVAQNGGDAAGVAGW